MSNWGFVGLAYGVTYAGLVFYALYLARTCSEAERLAAQEGQS